MTNEQISEIIKIIRCPGTAFPLWTKNIKSDMVTALHRKNSDKTALYNELDRLRKARCTLGCGNRTKTGISLVALTALTFRSQQELVFEYMADSKSD